MKYISILLIINIFFCNTIFSQIKKEKCDSCISQKTLSSFKYNPSVKKYTKFKVTSRTVFDKDIFVKSIDDGDLLEVFSEAQFSQFMQYNVRARWKFKNQNHIFIGTKTFVDSGSSKKISYIGFKKYF